MKNHKSQKIEYTKQVRIEKTIHIALKLALAQLADKTGHTIDIQEFVTQAIKEKIENSKILNDL